MSNDSNPLVVATDPLDDGAQRAIEGFSRYVVSSPVNAQSFREVVNDADVIVVRSRLPDEVVSFAPRLRAILRHGAGVDIIPVDRASIAGVVVGNVPSVNASAVAQYVLGQLLILRRKLRISETELRIGKWREGRATADRGEMLDGMTFGIVGYGAVGRKLAQYAAAVFGISVLVSTPRPSTVEHPAQAVSLDTLVRKSDAVILCCPLTPQTKGLVNAEVLAHMQRHAVLVNVARGAIIDENALLHALQDGRLGGAILDVFGTQPLAPDHPFTGLENVILTPHVAGCSAEVLRRIGAAIVEDARRVLAGDMPANVVNGDCADRIRQRWRELGPVRTLLTNTCLTRQRKQGVSPDENPHD